MNSGDFPTEEIAGVGLVSAGTYRAIEVAGVGKGQGNIVVQKGLQVAGVFRHRGDLTASEIEVAGMMRVSGDLQCGIAEFAGTGRVAGHVQAERLEVAGRLRVGGDLRGTRVHVGGQVRVGGELALERLEVELGSVQVGELLTAETIHLRLWGKSAARTVGGSSVVIRRGRFGWGVPWHGDAGWEWNENWDEEWTDGPVADEAEEVARPVGRPWDSGRAPLVWGARQKVLFRTEEIEADTVDAAFTRAGVIRADRVTLGEGCQVRLVEAREMTRHPSAQVGRFVQR